jgi:hypothetical protein
VGQNIATRRTGAGLRYPSDLTDDEWSLTTGEGAR